MKNALSVVEDLLWEQLLRSIAEGTCVPFIGAGASCPPLPTAQELLQKLCERFCIPTWAANDLSGAAEFVQISYGRHQLLQAIRQEIAGHPRSNDAHANLSALPWHTIVTTNYDGFFSAALSAAGKDFTGLSLPVRRDVDPHTIIPEPTSKRPLIIHAHGALPDAEIVITESDYYHYLSNMASGVWALPRVVQHSLAKSSYLFVGYSLRDWTFRLLFHSLGRYFQHDHFALIFAPHEPDEKTEYFAAYLQQFVRASVFFGDAQSFSLELQQRWEAFDADQP